MTYFDGIEQDIENWQNRVSDKIEKQKINFANHVKSAIEWCILSKETCYTFGLNDYNLLEKQDILNCLQELYDKQILRNIDFDIKHRNDWFAIYLNSELIK